MRILVVEDDALLGDGVKAGLAQAGFTVDWVKDGVSADLALKDTPFSAVVLDLGLPRLDGFELLKRMRARDDRVPVLILTARDAIEDRIKGLDGGADDYMVKPFDLHELAARLRALVRRAAGQAAAALRIGELELDPAAHAATYKGRPLDLAAREFALLHALMLHAGRVLTRDQLAERLYAWDQEIESNAIDVHIHHLRRKVSTDCIRTVRGVGYLLPRPPRD
jgi:two-component system OmpR family response regulator/two-component system response regulator QseB